MHHRLIPTLGKAEKKKKNALPALGNQEKQQKMYFRSGGKSKYSNPLVLARAGSSCLYIFLSRRIDEVFLAVTRGKIGICHLFRKRLLELCAEEFEKDAPFVSLYIIKVSLLSSDVILFLFFRPVPSLSTFPKTFIISSNYSFQSLVGIYFYITFALAFAFLGRLYIEIVLWKIYIERDR